MASSRLPLLALFLAAGCLLAGPAAAAPPPTAHALSAAASVLQGPVAAAPERPAVVWQTMDGLRGAVQADLDAPPATSRTTSCWCGPGPPSTTSSACTAW